MTSELKFWNDGKVRLNDDGSVDEVFALNGALHLEQMSGGHWWMAINGARGRRMVIHFVREKKDIRVAVEDDGYYSSGITAGFKWKQITQ